MGFNSPAIGPLLPLFSATPDSWASLAFPCLSLGAGPRRGDAAHHPSHSLMDCGIVVAGAAVDGGQMQPDGGHGDLQ